MNDYMMPPLEYTDIIFNSKPDAVPYNCRISYKVSQLCLLMERCGRAGVCSLVKIHMISYSLISKATRDVTIDKGKLCRWIAMCKFLEENATIDDKAVIGQWLKATSLQEQNDKLRAENQRLKAKIEALQDAVEGWLYE